ncbi:hypothetical protein HZC07_02305 [Candidatus Micrarchaeota archaeon]|nr:hypothetical protein [Candidatus Micrarchaeota archaeon]
MRSIFIVLGFAVLLLFGCCNLIPSTTPSENNPVQGSPVFAGKTYDQLLAMRTPLVCTVSGSTPARVYFDGGGSVRVEFSSSDASICTSAVVGIFKGNSAYIGCAKEAITAQCQWMVSNRSNTNEGLLSSIDAKDISCQGWSSDPTKFAIQGNVCSEPS